MILATTLCKGDRVSVTRASNGLIDITCKGKGSDGSFAFVFESDEVFLAFAAVIGETSHHMPPRRPDPPKPKEVEL